MRAELKTLVITAISPLAVFAFLFVTNLKSPIQEVFGFSVIFSMFIVPLVFVTSWIIFTNGDADIDFDGSDNVDK